MNPRTPHVLQPLAETGGRLFNLGGPYQTDASASQVPVEALASVEQAFTHEVERLKDECDRSISGQHDLLDRFDQKQRSLERQLTGLTSFAQHVEVPRAVHEWGSHSSG